MVYIVVLALWITLYSVFFAYFQRKFAPIADIHYWHDMMISILAGFPPLTIIPLSYLILDSFKDKKFYGFKLF